MASNSASSMHNANPKSSRFSTLKVFKFASKEKDSKPPPLPPKDPYYLQNKSLGSLSPDSLSLPPNSPLTLYSQFNRARRLSPDPNQSTMSLVSSAASAKSVLASNQPKGLKEKKSRTFLKFSKRGPKSQSSKGSSADISDPPPLPSTGDEGISHPWNFQEINKHNMHVDEGYVGLPPSWATSLANAGYTEEEITAIQARRTAGTRSPGSQYLYTDRPHSPAYLNPYMSDAPPPPVPPVPILTNPTPRTTSLPRQYSDASLRAAQQQKSPPLPTMPPRPPSPSTSSLQSNQAYSSIYDARSSPPRLPSSSEQGSHHTSSSIALSLRSYRSNSTSSQGRNGSISTRTALAPLEPSTPPRQVYHITNESLESTSPPPAYGNFYASFSADKKEKPSSQSTPSSSNAYSMMDSTTPTNRPRPSGKSSEGGHRTQPSTDTTASRSTTSSGSSSSFSPIRTPNRSKRTTALPPRLSLHKSSGSTDLSSWSAALLSGISSGDVDGGFASQMSASPRSPSDGVNSQLVTALPSSWQQQYPERKAGSPSQLQPSPREEGSSLVTGSTGFSTSNGSSPASPWGEVRSGERASLLRELQGIVQNGDLRGEEIFSAALTETGSPTLPFNVDFHQTLSATTGYGRVDSSSHGRPISSDSQLDADDSFLTIQSNFNRNSTRSSSSSLSTSTIMGISANTTIVRNVSIARRTSAYMIDNSKRRAAKREERLEESEREQDPYDGASVDSPASLQFPASSRRPVASVESRHPPSPLSSNFGSEEGSGSASGSSSSQSQDHPTPTTEAALDSPLMYYLDQTPSPDPSRLSFSPGPHHLMLSTTDTFGNPNKYDEEDAAERLLEEDEEDEDEIDAKIGSLQRPTIIINDASPSQQSLRSPLTSSSTPSTAPFQTYRGWLSEVVAPLEAFIDETVNPHEHYLDLQEIAEGESGLVYAARLSDKNPYKLKLPPLIKAKDSDDLANGRATLVAIKSVAILPSGSPKLKDLEKELKLMKGLWHENILGLDAVYVDLTEDSLWIRMELMERSLADIIGLVGEGLMLQDRMIGRFASDIVNALQYLQKHNIAHRDVRSDNLLLNARGILKLTDFSNAIQVTRDCPTSTDVVGVIYWQAPEMRQGPYNAMKVDVWSLGATVWEMAQTEPPFSDTNKLADRWPPLHQPKLYSPAFHDFLRRCSEPTSSRPDPSELINNSFINNACGRPVIVQLLSQCMAIEQVVQKRAVSGLDSN